MESNNICKLNLMRSSDLICTDFVYETQNAQAKERQASTYILGLAVSGKGVLCSGGCRHALQRGTIFAVCRGTRFSIENEESFRYLYICFHGRRADELASRFGIEAVLCVSDTEGRCEQPISFTLDCLEKANDSNLDIFAESALLYLMGHLEATSPSQNELIEKMTTLTNEYFSDASFSLNALATALGYDAKYLSFYFKKKKGIRFSTYLRDLRIKRAVFWMEQGVVSVKNVAILSGFGDALYFSKIFKEAIGRSPKAYIEALQGTER
jgi:AraC-like DNA-binding protein